MKFIKKLLVPAIATRATMHYWNGDYDKSFKLLYRANRWGPEMVRGSIFEGYLGLSLYRLGNLQDYKKHLISARDGIRQNPSADADISSVESALLHDIDRMLGNDSSL